eukprot:7022386-Prymnesium_polylepis.1
MPTSRVEKWTGSRPCDALRSSCSRHAFISEGSRVPLPSASNVRNASSRNAVICSSPMPCSVSRACASATLELYAVAVACNRLMRMV